LLCDCSRKRHVSFFFLYRITSTTNIAIAATPIPVCLLQCKVVDRDLHGAVPAVRPATRAVFIDEESANSLASSSDTSTEKSSRCQQEKHEKESYKQRERPGSNSMDPTS
jgi:hypothetical protein